MKKLTNWLKWLDTNILKILITFYIFFIPLYPKLPLHNINYTYIALRLEDLFMVLFLFIFAIQVLRKKVKLNKYFFILFILYWAAVFISAIWGVYVVKNIVISHLGLLNALRRVEYMSIFFIILSVVQSKKEFFYYLKLILITVLLVNIYGIGQKFLGWPAVQTMNPAYSKGYLLFLTPDARISSTYSGHYDLAAFSVFIMPIVLVYYFIKKQLRYFLLFIFSILIIIFTASRISYGAYIISIFPLLIFLKKPKHFIIILLITVALTLSSKTLTSRFSRTFQIKQIFVNQNTGQVVIPQKMTAELPAGSFYVGLNNGVDNSNNPPVIQATQAALLNERLLDEVRTDARSKGKVLTVTEENDIVASLSAKLKPLNSIVSDISFATRLQVEWPRALRAFLKNPILGTGPSSITEATDNDYLRSLGEVGLLGTGLFVIILFVISKPMILKTFKSHDEERLYFIGFLFGLFALLFNAGYIDVFEASKVAFQFWLIAGLFTALLLLKPTKTK